MSRNVKILLAAVVAVVVLSAVAFLAWARLRPLAAHAAAGRRIDLDPELAALERALAGSPLESAARAEVPKELRKRLGALLHWTYTFHVQNYRLPESLRLIPKE